MPHIGDEPVPKFPGHYLWAPKLSGLAETKFYYGEIHTMKRLTHEELKAIRLPEGLAAGPERRFPFIAIVEDVRSLYNVGSMFRTSDAARITALFTTGYTPHPPRQEIEKTALGATRTIPHRHFELVAEAIAEARRLGMQIAALELTEQSRSIFELSKSDFPLALVVGNEVTGVSHEALALSDFALEIPMIGAKHSFNVAVAFGVALVEAMRVFKTELQNFKP